MRILSLVVILAAALVALDFAAETYITTEIPEIAQEGAQAISNYLHK